MMVSMVFARGCPGSASRAVTVVRSRVSTRVALATVTVRIASWWRVLASRESRSMAIVGIGRQASAVWVSCQ